MTLSPVPSSHTYTHTPTQKSSPWKHTKDPVQRVGHRQRRGLHGAVVLARGPRRAEAEAQQHGAEARDAEREVEVHKKRGRGGVQQRGVQAVHAGPRHERVHVDLLDHGRKRRARRREVLADVVVHEAAAVDVDVRARAALKHNHLHRDGARRGRAGDAADEVERGVHRVEQAEGLEGHLDHSRLGHVPAEKKQKILRQTPSSVTHVDTLCRPPRAG